MMVSPILQFHPSVASGVGDCADDAVATGAVGSAVSSWGDPAERPQVGASATESFVGQCGGVAEQYLDGFFVGDVVQAVDAEQTVGLCHALGSGWCLSACFGVGGSEGERQLDDVVHSQSFLIR